MALSLHSQSDRIIDVSIPVRLGGEHGYRPKWLLVPYAALRWIVTDIGAKPNNTIRFDIRLPNGKCLTQYENLIESIKRIVFGVRTGPLMSVECGSVQATIASNLITLARWMIGNGIDRFEDLASADVSEYSVLASGGVHSILNTEGLLNLHLEKLFSAAGFDEKDTSAERQVKAMAIFPARVLAGNNLTVLHRTDLLEEAGLGNLGQSAANCPFVSILDEVEALCGFYQPPRVRQRMHSAPSIDELDDKQVTGTHIQRLLMSFTHLYQHRRFLNDAMQISPFYGSSAAKEACKLGKTVGRTACIPMKQAATLIERSIRWVLDYAPDLLRIAELGNNLFDEIGQSATQNLNAEIRVTKWPIAALASPFPILPGQRGPTKVEVFDDIINANGMTLPIALNFLQTACAVVIAAFSARRSAEIIGLKAGCIERDECGKPWLCIFIHKTEQKNTTIPVPEIVAVAVGVLEQLSERARAKTGTPYLFQFIVPGTDIAQGVNPAGLPNFKLGVFLRKFGYFIDVPVLPDGTRWTFCPHQFRKLFAILYIWVYELGDWGALSFYLRHFNLDMTKRYASDAELGHIIAMANKQHTAEVLANAALGKTQINGLHGERLTQAAKRLHARLVQQIQVVPERKFAQRIARFVERADITLRAFPWGYCAFSKTVKKTFVCALDKSSSDFGSANVSTCSGCEFGVGTDASLPYLRGSIRFHQAIAHSSTSPEILQKASLAMCLKIDEYIVSVTPKLSILGPAS